MGGAFKWPSLHEVLDYRSQVRELVIDVIENAPLKLPITQQHPWVSELDPRLVRDNKNIWLIGTH